MKIGINVSFLRKPGTGIGQVTAHFLEKLAEYQSSNSKYQSSEFFLYCEEKPTFDFELPENFEVKSFLPRWWKRDDVPRKWLWECEAARRAEADGCDVFLSLYQSATRFSGRQKIRHTMMVHDIIPKLFPEYIDTVSRRMYWRAVERGIRSADNIIALSESTGHDLLEYLGVPAEKISVAHPDTDPRFRVAVSDEAADAVMKKYGLVRGYIYHGGGLEVRKNAKRLLEAYVKLLRERQGTDIPPLVISGRVFPKSNTLATDIEGLMKELELEESVKLLGFVPDEDLPALYRGALFFAYPSLYEGFGLPVLEAMRMGTPVLAAKTSSLPEVGGDAVLYCDPENVDSIMAGMERLLADETLRQTLISKSSVQAVQFDWNVFVEKISASLFRI